MLHASGGAEFAPRAEVQVQISRSRFAVLVAALSVGATVLGMVVGLAMGRGLGGAADVATIAGLVLLAGTIVGSGMGTRPFGTSVGLLFTTTSAHYMGIDALTGDDLRRTQDQYDADMRRSSPLAALLGTSAVCTLVVSAILNGIL